MARNLVEDGRFDEERASPLAGLERREEALDDALTGIGTERQEAEDEELTELLEVFASFELLDRLRQISAAR